MILCADFEGYDVWILARLFATTAKSWSKQITLFQFSLSEAPVSIFFPAFLFVCSRFCEVLFSNINLSAGEAWLTRFN